MSCRSPWRCSADTDEYTGPPLSLSFCPCCSWVKIDIIQRFLIKYAICIAYHMETKFNKILS